MTQVLDTQHNTFEPPERESLVTTEQSLAKMKERLDAILNAPALTDETLVEITAILNNVSYVFLYLEANNDQVSYHRLLPFRDTFYQNDELDTLILKRLRELKCGEPSTERSRQAYIKQMEDKQQSVNPKFENQISELRAEASAAEASLNLDQASFIERFGLSGSRPSASYYRLSARTESPALRSKLARAWNKVAESEVDCRAGIVDRMIKVRHQDAVSQGKTSPLAQTLGKCRISSDEIEAFLTKYLDAALAGQAELTRALVEKYGDDTLPFSHFGHFMRANFRQKEVPLFDLDRCLRYAFQMAASVFALDISISSSGSMNVIVAEASFEGQPVGRINFDLWSQSGQDRGANHTLGLRNKADWGHVIQRPEAYVSCRFNPADDGAKQITFQNVHSLFHEFGHALNHLLMREHLPNRSGLEYLPLERLECLSMWSEKWVYHPSFTKALELSPDEQGDLILCQDAKKIEYVSTFAERALIALIDFECHRKEGVTLRMVFDQLDHTHGISQFVKFSDIPQYFSWPMFIANPGANFSYLFGAAWSVEAFKPFTDHALGPEMLCMNEAYFLPCFSIQMPSIYPDPKCLPEFYLSGLYSKKQLTPQPHHQKNSGNGAAL